MAPVVDNPGSAARCERLWRGSGSKLHSLMEATARQLRQGVAVWRIAPTPCHGTAGLLWACGRSLRKHYPHHSSWIPARERRHVATLKEPDCCLTAPAAAAFTRSPTFTHPLSSAASADADLMQVPDKANHKVKLWITVGTDPLPTGPMHTPALLPLSLALCVTLLLPACGQKAEQDAPVASYSESAPAAPAAVAEVQGYSMESATPAPAAEPEQPAQQLTSSAITQTDPQRKFIRSANAAFRVKDVYRSALAIEDIVAANGGFVVHNEIKSDVDSVERHKGRNGMLVELALYTVNGNLSVRVPSERTQIFLRALASEVEFLDQRTFDALDAQFEILRSQQEARRNQQAQQDLGELAQQKGKLPDRADLINSRTGYKAARDEADLQRYQLEDKVAFSTINLTLYQARKLRRSEVPDLEAAVQREGPGFFPRLGASLVSGWHGLLEALLALVQVWPLLLAGAAVLVLIRRLRRKK